MTYEQKLNMADAMYLTDSSNRDYWSGYKRGLEQARRGGDLVEHHNWMTMSGDEHREACCHGYRDGYSGHHPDPGTRHDDWR